MFLLVSVLALTMLGCKRTEVAQVRVVGKVTFQGKPVPQGCIIFSATDNGSTFSADLSADGLYEVASGKGTVLAIGTYQVCIAPPRIVPDKLGSPNVKRRRPEVKAADIPAKYRDFATSNLTLLVKEGDNVFDVDMKP